MMKSSVHISCVMSLKTLLGHSQIQTTFAYVSPGDDFLEKRIRMAQSKWQKQLETYEEKTGG